MTDDLADETSSLFAGCREWSEAVALLLGAHLIEREWTVFAGSTFHRLDLCAVAVAGGCAVRSTDDAPDSPLREHFESRETFALPDNAPPRRRGERAPTQTPVHRFVLRAPLRRAVCAATRTAATAGMAARLVEGVTVSNVGGFHSPEAPLAESCCAELAAALQAAAKALAAESDPDDEPLELTAWINANPPRAFNALHTHGTAEWSLVYFADDGSGGNDDGDHDGGDGDDGHGDDGHDGDGHDDLRGALLLKTQLAPRTLRFAYLAIVPRAGELWAFPGYVPHAVLPRELPSGTSQRAAATRPNRLRLSVACNAQRAD